jgi:hypothetical protein
MAAGRKLFGVNRLKKALKPDLLDCDEVARVAYELYERRGCEHGRDREDWLQAEEIVRRRNEERAAFLSAAT